ncbi:uncharacterized protein A4U43_C03F23710 [Asparagus officinalis]|uniref:RRM domain-containing protein n=1 Tax=Asparagus officinalis TaxID=4686 RepID=A0A5P1FDF1_ASPOF|nr:uncharacterized protein A4U43_C03F23710 [Asparagus officinalis]
MLSSAASSGASRGPPTTTDSHSLQQAFSAYGDVIDSKIINDRETGRSRGFGFVTFGSEQAMKDAIEGMNGQNLDGRSITVNEAQSRGSGGGGGGGFRSRPGTRRLVTEVNAVKKAAGQSVEAWWRAWVTVHRDRRHTGVGSMAGGAGGTEKRLPRSIYVRVSEFGF